MIVHLDRFSAPIEGAVYSRLWCRDTNALGERAELDLVAGENADTLIPDGEYDLVPDDTGRFRWWVLLGGPLGLAGSGALREQIELHSGNWPAEDSKGCPIVGRALGAIGHSRLPGRRFGLIDSIPALRTMRAALGSTETHRIVVRTL